MNFLQATTHDFLVGNRECNKERGFKNQLYIELGTGQNLGRMHQCAACAAAEKG